MCFGISDSSDLCPLQGIYVVHADPRAGWAVVSGSNRSSSLQVDKPGNKFQLMFPNEFTACL